MASAIILALILLIPIILIPRLAGWPKSIQYPTKLLRSWRQRPKQCSEIISLRMYPIKSCRGLEVQSTVLKQHGLDLDRRWMLIDASSNTFLTIRQIPDMTRIRTALSADGDDLIVSIPKPGTNESSQDKFEHQVQDQDQDQEHQFHTIRIPSHPSPQWLAENTNPGPVQIWDTHTDGYRYSDEINAPFSAFLRRDVALVYKGPTPRVLKGNGAPSHLGRVQTTGFPDVHPVLIASEASLAELNARLGKAGVDPITVERFRPNIVVRGGAPWSEDSWKLVRINGQKCGDGEAVIRPSLDLDIVARCARCQVPNVDPDTALKHKKQPWDTLVSYRRVDEGIKYKPCFGMLSAPRNEGTIEVGMELEVLEETTEHRYMTGF
ncbi:MOSC N-terminal beta barrel [Penicillium robsamsonii]|uniref:MOSC N-terminal beta barrel n=1 Tax=Penicillium robsamsonii TaxID=1792511 RepID=UPI0025470BBE|nr:MOSC N-terminal beta barrel [Penicillium robsamsonii]KAJ5822955.1 MOSC N-terminal beta barrel [Penicillium robsamsonii]